MFGSHPFGWAYPAQGYAGSVGPAPDTFPHTVHGFASYAARQDGFGSYIDQLDGFGSYQADHDGFAIDED